MMILDDYVTEVDQQNKQSAAGGGNTPMLRRSASSSHARHLPPIREASKSSSKRMYDTGGQMSDSNVSPSFPHVVPNGGATHNIVNAKNNPPQLSFPQMRKSAALEQFKVETTKRRDLFPVLTNSSKGGGGSSVGSFPTGASCQPT